MKVSTTSLEEPLTVGDVDLLERFQAVSDEPGTNHRDARLLSSELDQCSVGIGLQLLLSLEARLVGDDHPVARPPEPLENTFRRPLAMLGIWVSLVGMPLRQTVKADNVPIGLPTAARQGFARTQSNGAPRSCPEIAGEKGGGPLTTPLAANRVCTGSSRGMIRRSSALTTNTARAVVRGSGESRADRRLPP